MAEWRFAHGWSDEALAQRLRALDPLPRNFDTDANAMTEENGWHRYHSESVVATEAVGPPGPVFRRLQDALHAYEFSDPAIVEARYDPQHALLGRRMLLELKVLGLRYLVGVVVAAVRNDRGDDTTVYGYRYETLEGHIERGAEWFLLTKTHATGEIGFCIDAQWCRGQLPNWWSDLGFRLLQPRCQRRWHRLAHARLKHIGERVTVGETAETTILEVEDGERTVENVQ